ncbi:MAG: efflux RND transporter periplasmic adaptor subunit [Proteobacteria bacterium]|nr:efflux RND transporter periplasmic adaptor subunit [Pseudomonadota bacterium]
MTAPTRRVHALPAILAAIGMVVALIYRHELIAWFTGALTIETAMQPDPPRELGNHARVVVRTATGQPVRGATLHLEYVMPAMGGMQEMRGGADAREDGEGRYTIPFDLPMGGSWTVEIRVTSTTGGARARYALRVGAAGLTPLGGEATSSTVPELPGAIRVDEGRRASLGIRTAKVVRAPLIVEVRAAGRLVVDETRLHDVTLKVGGYVTDLKVNATGQHVGRGDTLFTLYSPELYAAQQEYLIARTALHGEALVQAGETRLRLLGIGDDQLRAIVAQGAPLERMPFRSPAGGVVLEKAVVEGDAVTAGQRLFRIADLDQIWVEADVFEADLARITKGSAATITLTYLPGRTLVGTVAFVYPYLDPTSRTGRVRIALANKGLELKPDMFATVAFTLPLGVRLQIPSAAVVYTGPRRLVFVDLGEGRLVPREVTLGARAGESVEVVSGLAEGDVIVTSGNFLVAAESRVRAGALWEGGSAGR